MFLAQFLAKLLTCIFCIKSTILKSLTKECIGKLEKTGLNMVEIVCDEGSNNRSFLHQVENVTLKRHT